MALARRVGVAICLCAGLSACAMGHLSSAGSSRAGDAHQGMRDHAATLSRTAWDRVVNSGSTLSAWATILMEGRSNQHEEGLAAAASSAPEAYLALKTKSFKTDASRLAAVVGDVTAKTAEADAFIAFAQSVHADAQRRIAAVSAVPANPEAAHQRAALAEDKRILEQAVADLRSQKATYSEVERELRAASPPLDTSSLKAALEALGTRITRLVELSQAMDA
jgi:hypothetical protein